MFGLLVAIAAVALAYGGFYYWARRQGLLSARQAAERPRGNRRVPLLTEAIAYVGAILILAGGVAAMGRQWHSLAGWERAGVLGGAAVLFLLTGLLVRRVDEPAIQRLTDVVWFLSAACLGGAVGTAGGDVRGRAVAVTALAAGLAVAGYSAVLWLVRQRALQNFAMFAGLVTASCALVFVIDSSPPSVAFTLLLWGLGLAWAWLGWRRYLEPLWVSVPSGVLLALIAPSIAADDHGWVYAIGIATAAAAMAGSVLLRNTPLLAVGTLAAFSYITSVVIRYLRQPLGVPGALAITGVLILGLAAVSARLMRATHPPRPREPGAAAPSGPARPGSPGPSAEKPPGQDLPRAS